MLLSNKMAVLGRDDISMNYGNTRNPLEKNNIFQELNLQKLKSKIKCY